LPPQFGRLAGLLPATRERAKRAPLAQRAGGSSDQSQPVHFHFSGFTANASLASAEIALLLDHDFSSANLLNARRPGPEPSAFRQVSPRRK